MTKILVDAPSREIQIEFYGLADHLIPGIADSVRKYLRILPPWVREIAIEMSRTDDLDLIAYCDHMEDYGRLKIFLTDYFFSRTLEQQDDDLKHEIVHSVLTGSHDLIDNLLSKMKGPAVKVIKEMHLKIVEQQIVHLTSIL